MYVDGVVDRHSLCCVIVDFLLLSMHCWCCLFFVGVVSSVVVFVVVLVLVVGVVGFGSLWFVAFFVVFVVCVCRQIDVNSLLVLDVDC